MAKFIIDTDAMAEYLSCFDPKMRRDILLNDMRDAHAGKTLQPWLSPYEEKKKRGMNGSGPYSESFEVFWAAYPTRNGKKAGKRPAFKAWCKVARTKDEILPGHTEETILLESCLVALEWQKQHEDWTKNDGTYIPMASTYLNAEGWTDEKPAEIKTGKKIAKSY